jgi:hypothetical protein
VRAITKGLVRGVPATAETDGRPASQAKEFTFGIEDLEVAFNADRSVVIHRYFRGRHFFSRGTESMPILPRNDKHKCPHPPIILYECQNKGLTEFAFRKQWILKGAILVALDLEESACTKKKKSGSKLPHCKHTFIQR